VTTFFQSVGAALFLFAVLAVIVIAAGFITGFIFWLFGEAYSWGWW